MSWARFFDLHRLTIHLPSGITPSFAGGRAVQRNGSRIRRRLKCLFLVRLFSFSRRMTMDLLRDNVRAVYRKYFLAAFGSALISCIYGVVDMAMVGQYQGPDGTAALAVVAPVWNISTVSACSRASAAASCSAQSAAAARRDRRRQTSISRRPSWPPCCCR